MATTRCETCYQGNRWRFIVVYDALCVIACDNCGTRRVYERHYDQQREKPTNDSDAAESADTIAKHLEASY